MKNQLDKAMESIALGYVEGNVPIDVCIKACESYNAKLPAENQFQYDLIVSKSCIDSINGNARDEELCKAITPFQTKVIDGVMYVYSPTKVGSKLQYDWHVVQTGRVTKKQIGKGSKLTKQELSQAYKYVNSLFPKDLSSVKVLNVAVGGSTGAKRVQDVNGVQYIRKRGDGSQHTNNGHVKNEYIAGQLYNLMGLRAPELELYDDNGVNVTLSKYIGGCREIRKTSADAKLLAQGFIADCLMSNWDVYRNSDNCLIDPSGKVYRVDNGGCLNYRAQGDTKPFDGNVLKSFNDMVNYNPAIYSELTTKDIEKQIKDIQSRKEDIVNFLIESDETILANTMAQRIDNLSQILNQISQNQNIEDFPIPKKRKIKSGKEMYRTLTQKELDDIWKGTQGSTAKQKLIQALNSNGSYEILGKICALRGFDGIPEVNTDTDFWKNHSNSDKQLFRGIAKKPKDIPPLVTMERNLLFDDGSRLYYGSPDGASAYGEGLYFHCNNGKGAGTTKTDYKNGAGYIHAVRYGNKGGSTAGAVIKGCLADDANVVDFEDLKKEILSLNLSSDQKAYSAQKKIVDKLNEEVKELEHQVKHFNDILKGKVFKAMKYDEQSYGLALTELDGVDWGKVTPFGDRDIPSFKDMVEGKLVKFVKEQGGDAKIEHNTVTFTLPNASKPLIISITSYDGDYSILRKNPFSPARNYAIERFKDWMNNEHVIPAENALAEEAKNSITKSAKLQSELSDKRYKRDLEEANLRDLVKIKGTESILHGIYKCVSDYDDAAVGVYAALKGYDVIRKNFGGNSGRSNDNDFYIVLNRTKLILSNSIDNV